MDQISFKQVLPYVKPYKKQFICILFFSILAASIDILLPLFNSYAISNFIEPKTTEGIPLFVLIYLAAIILQTIATVIFSRSSMYVELSIGKELKRTSFRKLQTLSFSYYNVNPVGQILSKVITDSNRISSIFSWTIMDMAWSLLYVIGAFISMCMFNVPLALLVMTVVPAIALVTLYFQNKLLHANRNIREVNAKIVGAYNEGIMGAKTSKTLGIEEKNYEEFQEHTKEMRKANISLARMNGIYVPVISLFSSIATAIVLVRGGYLVQEDLIDLAVFSVFISYAVGIFVPIQEIAKQIAEFIATRANIERVFGLHQTVSDVEDSPEVIEKYGDLFHPKVENWEDLLGEITFEDVSFKYPDGGDYILQNFNLHIPAGATVAIVGETGAGKSTLVNLACRFFEPTSGRILIDGKDYKERSQLWLHRNIGYVLQSPHLFSGTIKDNIKYGCLDASDEQVDFAVKTVKADLVINKLEKGYDALVGESGDSLSTGEKQLISFARAVVANPPIFVLDEATSSIDTETEALIQDAIATVLKGRTSFIIAHRLSTIRKADIILVVENGKIIERGTHKELLSAKGHYHHLYSRQFQEEAFAKLMDSL